MLHDFSTMPILYKDSQGSRLVDNCSFKDEAELKTVLATTPSRIVRDEDPQIALVARQVRLIDSGCVDLLSKIILKGLIQAIEVA